MPSEFELIENCKKGDHKAFEALYVKYARKMMAIALRYCSTNFEAEDVIQESFIKVFGAIKAFENKGSFEGWLKRIVVNNSINAYTKNKKITFNEDYSKVETMEEMQEDFISKLSTDELLHEINQLPIGYRTVFSLYVIEEYTHKEIGELLSISEGTSKSQLAKAKVMLKKRLEENLKCYR